MARLLLAALTLVSLLALAGCGGHQQAQSGALLTTGTTTTPRPTGPPRHPLQDGPSTANGAGPQLTVVLADQRALGRLHLAAFASLTSAAGRPLGTQPLDAGPVYYTISHGDYRLTVTFSPCRDDCRVFHGGTALSPLLIHGAAPARVVITPACSQTAAGLDCSASKIRR